MGSGVSSTFFSRLRDSGALMGLRKAPFRAPPLVYGQLIVLGTSSKSHIMFTAWLMAFSSSYCSFFSRSFSAPAISVHPFRTLSSTARLIRAAVRAKSAPASWMAAVSSRKIPFALSIRALE